jgi:tetratricopeptide (TPR) repeat protein
MSKNYVALYQGLKVFRDAMLAFIKARLEAVYGDEWWERGVRRVFRDEDIAQLEKDFERRFSGLPIVTRPGVEQHEILDINYFNNIIDGNWKQVFAEPFDNDRGVLVWLKEVTTLRNAVMHFETGDLSDDDTWRGLDTMERILRIVEPRTAKVLAQLKQDVYEVSAKPEFRPAWLDLREGSLDYGQGLSRLENAIVEQDGAESETYLDFQGYRRQLITVLGEKRLTPGVRDNQLEVRKEHILRELDRLATHFLGISFTDACIVSPPPLSLEDSLHRIQELEREIQNLVDKLYAKQWKKLAQRQTGETIPKLERDIERIQSQLDQKRDELVHLKDAASPPAFFAVSRKIEPNGTHPRVEEQPIRVSVEITNLGRQAVTIHYKEGVPEDFEVLEGTLDLEVQGEPGETAVHSYTCYATRPGQHRLFVKHIDYKGRISVWDRIEDTIVEVRPGTEPLLVANRYYRYVEEGLELLVHLENKGDKIARNVRYEEEVEIEGQPEASIVTFEGDIIGGSPGRTIECRLQVSEPEKVHFPDKTEIVYSDNQGQVKTFALTPDWKRIEYDFPRTPKDIAIVGRESEIQLISTIVDQVWQLAHGQYRPGLKRLLFFEGIEGAGKTKLVYELLELAQQRGFNCFMEDAKARSPVKQMLKRLLGLRPAEDDDKLIWKRLEEQLPGEEHSLQREVIFRLISTTMSVQFSQEELDLLEANVLVLVKTLCRRAPTLLVFEDIHWTPEGTEEQLLLALFHSVLVSKDEPILLCATYRPGETGPLPVVGKLKMSRDYYEVLELGSIGEEGTRALVDQIVDFPYFSEPLYRFVCDWSHSNPFYLIELLRLLTNPDANYLTRVGSEWYPAYTVDLGEIVPKTVEGVILERVNLELPDEADFVKVLSAIGFELPLSLVEALSFREFPEWSQNELYRRLAVVERAGLLVAPDKEGKESKIKGYEFEHQLKREVLYESLPGGRQLQLRKQIAEILLDRQVFPGPGEQTRQLARHLVKSPREFQVTHLEKIKKAATLERGLRNFSRSLEFYDAALELVPDDSFEAAHLLVERSRLHQMRGNLLPAERDLEQAYRLISPESPLAKQDGKSAKHLRILVEKEQGRVLLKQPQASLDRANSLLYQARVGMEGILQLRRFFPPKSLEFHRDLVEIYLALAEVWLRKRDFKTCEKVCRRAERLAQNARKKLLRGESLLPRVYMALGDLHLERGIKQEDYEEALTWYRLALEYVEEDRYEQERIWLALADTYRALGDSAQARQHYERAVEIQKQLGDTYGLALSFGGIGDLFVEQRKFEQGRYYCEQAHQYQQLVGDLNRFWRTCVSLTKIHLNDGDFEKAWGYWLQARTILFEQRRFDDLRSRKQREICDLIREFAEYHKKGTRWEKLRACLQDLDHVLPSITWERGELTSVQMALGEACFKTGQWQDAIAAFTKALELAENPIARAEIHEWLGDVYAAFELPTHTLVPPAAWKEEAQDQAEHHYEEAVKQLTRIGNVRRAVTVYEKLLGRIVTDEAGLLQLPQTFKRILDEMPLQQRIHDQFVNKAEEVLLRNELPAEAGDIVVYTARAVTRVDDSIVPFDDKIAYLRRAEALYRRGKPEDLIWGLNMLIPTYYRLGLWDEVVRCFKALFELNLQIEDVDEFIETYMAIWMLEDRIEAVELESFTKMTLAGPQQTHFSNEQQMRLFLYVAKTYSGVADKIDNAEEKRRYEDLALGYFERVREIAPENTAILTVVLNDSALIFDHRTEYEEALQRMDQAIRIGEQFGNYKGAAEVRVNRADLYIRLEEYGKALRDHEQALEFLQRVGNYWNERLQRQDQQPLSPTEVVSMRHDRSYLASACAGFAEFLLSRGEPARAQDLATEAMQLYYEVGKPEAAMRMQTILALSKVMSGTGPVPAEEVPDTVIKRVWPCPSCGEYLMEGTVECPACGESLCPECGATVDEEATECPKCGIEFELVCPRCDATLSADEDVCPHCGLDFSNVCPQCGYPVDLEQGLCPNCGQAICPECGAAVGDDDEECASCGVALVLSCPECGTEVSAKDAVCPQCGEPFATEDNEEENAE